MFGPIWVTRAFLPLLKAADCADIVLVSSGLGSLSDLANQSHGGVWLERENTGEDASI